MGGSYGFKQFVSRDVLPAQAAVASSQWFAVETRVRYEKKVASQLAGKGFQVFLPQFTEHHQWSDRRKPITTPMFPGYAFVFLAQSRDLFRAVLQTAGLVRFVNFGGVLTAVPPKQIEDMRLLLQEKSRFSPYPFVQTGQRVRIGSGSLQGLEGILLKCDKDKLIVSIQSIQRSIAIEIQGYALEPI
jgi:transcription antitermination factor NusG